jgi:drug/metabolite transporter (DMT)-like permease
MHATTDRRRDAGAASIAILVMAILGGSYTAGKVAVQDLPVFGTLELRMLITAATPGFVLMVWLINTYSASWVNVFVFLSPVFGVVIGWATLGEPISVQQALGGLAVALGILIVSAER